jgi:hypothetical protein
VQVSPTIIFQRQRHYYFWHFKGRSKHIYYLAVTGGTSVQFVIHFPPGWMLS